MSHEMRADHSQPFLLPPSMEDWVPPDHPVRFIRDFVAALDLKALGFRERPSEVGRPHYANDLLLSVWLYGYMERIRSARKLEHACRTHMPLIWLTGMHYPDHNTLWRFWSAHGKALRGVLRQSVLLARQLGLVGMVVHALDGTKIAVQSSPRSALHRSDLEKLHAAIEESIAAMEAAVEAEGACEEPSSTLPDALQEAHARRAAIAEGLAQLDAHGQKHLMPGETDARMMQQANRTAWALNAQAVVDDAHGIVVGADVTNEAADFGQLGPMLDVVEEMAGATAHTTVADAVYRSAHQEIQAHEQGRGVLVPEHGRDKDNGTPYHRSQFEYDAEQDRYTCPEGQVLEYTHTKPASGNKPEARIYRCRACKHCPVRSHCTTNKTGRTLRRDAYEEFRAQQRAHRETPEAKALMRRRKAIVEPLFGHIKENMGFRRWSARGLANATVQWSMLCLAVNLKKIYARWKEQNGPNRPLPPSPRLAQRRSHAMHPLMRPTFRQRAHPA